MSKFLIMALTIVLTSLPCSGQAAPAALQKADFSMFAAATGNYTGLSGGRNAGVTGGLDLNLPGSQWFRPSLELRATVPVERGKVDSQKSLIGGLRLEERLNHFYPYLDFLAGEGKITFPVPYGLPSGKFLFSQPSSTVISPGLGLRYAVTPHIQVFADAQLQRWSTPASLSGHLFAKPLSAGLVLRFGLPQHRIP